MSQDTAATPSKKPKLEAKPAAAKPDPPDVETGEEGEDGKPMTFWEHLDELRSRLVRSLIAFFVAIAIAWNYHEQIKDYLTVPLSAAWKTQGLPGDGMLHFATPAGAFTTYFKLSMIGGGLLVSPFIFYQLWSFIAPGLYAREKRFVIPFVLCSTLLFVGGAYFAYQTAVPISLTYFFSLSGGTPEAGGVSITPTIMMDEYFGYIGQILLGFGLVFELPLLLLFLSIAGVVNYLQLIRFGRWFVLVAFIVGAVLTPPDITSQLVMAVPMCLLYFVSIGLVYLFGKRPTEAQREAYRRSREKDKAGAD